MRRVLVSLSASLLIVGLVVGPATAAGRSSDPFTGAWKATDFDGSAMSLQISGAGPTRHVVFFDLSCGSCEPAGFPFVFIGTGEVDGSTLTVAAGAWHAVNANLPGMGSFGVSGFTVTAAGDGTLEGDFTQIWYRAGQ